MYFQVIVAVSFINNAILDGIAYSFGVLLNKLVLEFHSNASTVSWVGSLVPGKERYSCTKTFKSNLEITFVLFRQRHILSPFFAQLLKLQHISYLNSKFKVSIPKLQS